MGDIRRLSAAIVINHRKDVDKNGQPVNKPLPDAEMKQINELVREAMGFNKERGDSISVANAPFTAGDKNEASAPLWKDPENISIAKDLVKYLLIALIVAFLFKKVIQPSLKTMFPSPEERRAAAEAEKAANATNHARVAGAYGEQGADTSIMDNYADKVQKARDIAQTDPKAVANIIKDWMGANAS
jgi:flagellar M-ring protein FliF